MPRVAIVLATYNGARHLSEQLESLRGQDFGAWRLYVRDDGSRDGTPELLARAAREDPRITVLETRENLGVIRNFGALLGRAHADGADVVFMCDQDDVWLPSKVSRALAVLADLERAHGPAAPLLVHSDLRVVDEALAPIHPSFLAYQAIGHEEERPLGVLLVQNFVTGCAAAVNRALLDLALPFPAECLMHDWWLAQCAAARGAIGFVPEPTILYRQHASNQIGAGGVVGNFNVFHPMGRKRLARSWRTALLTVEQCRALGERLRDRGGAPAEALRMIEGYAHIEERGRLARVRTLRALGIRRQRRVLTALLYGRVALFRRVPPDGRASDRRLD